MVTGLGMAVTTRKQAGAAEICIRALQELDALVSEHVMGERPSVHWEDSLGHFQFDSRDEALEAMSDPLVKEFLPEDNLESLTIHEVKEFSPYSSQLGEAWKVVEHLGLEKVKIERAGESWRAAFGICQEIEAPTPAVAICLAALRCRGMEVKVETDFVSEHP